MQLETYAERLSAVRGLLDDWQVDGLLVDGRANRQWLSGFAGSLCQLLITADKAILSTDSRYWEQAAQQAPDFTLFRNERMPESVRRFIESAGVNRIGIESRAISLGAAQKLHDIEGIEWKPLDQTLEPLRMVKSRSEIERIKAAAALTDQAMAMVPGLVKAGMTERALAWELEKAMREAGADSLAFDIIVAGGPHSAMPHHSPGDRPLQKGDLLVVDMGAQLDYYKSDLTRSFYLGSEPSSQFQEVYDLVAAAHAAVMEGARPGMNAMEVDALARTVIGSSGQASRFGHGLGHGLGLEIHEEPMLSHRPPADKTIVAAGMVVTVEPGVYIPNWGGVRIEDLALFTESGIESLSQCPNTPIIPV